MKTRLSDNLRELIKNSYTIIDEIDITSVDNNFKLLSDRLASTKKLKYNDDEKYVIVHYDTDYYLPHARYGLSMYNLTKTFMELDISLSNVIFVTNHKGIKKEFKLLMPDNNYDMPIIIDDCLSCFATHSVLINTMQDIPNNFDKISKHAICMIGNKRVHRNIVYNALTASNLLNKVVTSYNNIL